jgi:hypothetical protein
MVLSLFSRSQPVGFEILGPEVIPPVTMAVLLPPRVKQASPGLEPLGGLAHF